MHVQVSACSSECMFKWGMHMFKWVHVQVGACSSGCMLKWMHVPVHGCMFKWAHVQVGACSSGCMEKMFALLLSVSHIHVPYRLQNCSKYDCKGHSLSHLTIIASESMDL